jgi:hypothetical protein
MQNSAFWENQPLVSALARELVRRRPGDRLPTVGQFQEQLGVGSGTVQARLRALESAGAISLKARGREGTFLVDVDVTRLWLIGNLGPIRGILPLPEAFEPVALAVMLRRAFQEFQIPLELLHLHSSGNRIELVREGKAHFAVASKPAADLATETDPSRWLRLDLEPGSYHREDSIVVLLRPHLGSDDRITRIGVDTECGDHAALTAAEFPLEEGYTYSTHNHSRLPAAVAEGIIDAAIWLRTTPVIPLSAVGIGVRPLHRPEAIALNRDMGSAVLLADAECPEAWGVLQRVELSATRAIQEEILRTGTLPLY